MPLSISICICFDKMHTLYHLDGFIINAQCLLADLSHWLMVSHCDSWMSVVRCQQLLQGPSSPKLLARILPNFGRDDSYI